MTFETHCMPCRWTLRPDGAFYNACFTARTQRYNESPYICFLIFAYFLKPRMWKELHSIGVLVILRIVLVTRCSRCLCEFDTNRTIISFTILSISLPYYSRDNLGPYSRWEQELFCNTQTGSDIHPATVRSAYSGHLAYLIEDLCYKPDGRGFESQWGHWNAATWQRCGWTILMATR
jgi:hypothetical protein